VSESCRVEKIPFGLPVGYLLGNRSVPPPVAAKSKCGGNGKGKPPRLSMPGGCWQERGGGLRGGGADREGGLSVRPCAENSTL
jgi:hypothetical protein